MTRPIRDRLAEAMRRERLGLMRPLWADWWDEAQEPYRLRADHLIRILTELGIELVVKGDPVGKSLPENATICANPIAGDSAAERVIRLSGDNWSILLTRDGTETVEQSFTLDEASILAGMVLAGDPEAGKRPALGKMLAAAVEIYRLNAAGMGGSHA